jgi:hypothetical protein
MPTVAAAKSKGIPHWTAYLALAPFALGTAFAGSSGRRRKGCQMLCVTAVAALCFGLVSCGGSAMNNTGANQQGAGPFTVSVTASSGNIQLGTQITVTTQ